jgi:hypothetical protein
MLKLPVPLSSHINFKDILEQTYNHELLIKTEKEHTKD